MIPQVGASAFQITKMGTRAIFSISVEEAHSKSVKHGAQRMPNNSAGGLSRILETSYSKSIRLGSKPKAQATDPAALFEQHNFSTIS
jgi:hypothetical protein